MIGATTCAKVVVAYYASWDIYARNFNVWQIDTTSITHINYAFANISNGQVVQGDPWADSQKVNVGHGDSWSDPADYLHGNFYQLYRLKQANRHLKTMISIGGWTWSGQFSTIASTATSRATFAKSAVDFILTFGFDGIDIDWEYPVSGGLETNARSPEDGANYVLLMQEIREQAAIHTDRRILLTAGISGGIYALVNFQLAAMDQYVDFFSMMAYDFTGAWSPTADHQSNLLARSPDVDSIQKAVQYALEQGVTPRKLVIGLPLYGRSFARTAGLGQPFDGLGSGSWEPGSYDYNTLPSAGSTPQWDAESGAPFCYNEETQELVSYDTPASVSQKLDWMLQLGLGGVMFWEISGDYSFSDPRSLLGEASRWLRDSLDVSENELNYPMSPYLNIRGGAVQREMTGAEDEDS